MEVDLNRNMKVKAIISTAVYLFQSFELKEILNNSNSYVHRVSV